jgi:hypothetical protein
VLCRSPAARTCSRHRPPPGHHVIERNASHARPQKVRKKEKATPLQIRLTAEEKTMFAEAAEREHLTLSAWLRLAGLHAVQEQHKLTGVS